MGSRIWSAVGSCWRRRCGRRRGAPPGGIGGGARVVGHHHDGLAQIGRRPLHESEQLGGGGESSAPVGSSAKITSGLLISARAQATRCCWPPESWLGRWQAVAKPDRVDDGRAKPGPACAARSSGSVMFSPAVRVGMRLNDWKTKPMRSRRNMVSASSASGQLGVADPGLAAEVSRSSPATQCMRVDLPEPEGPMIAVKSPALEVDRHAVEGAPRCRPRRRPWWRAARGPPPQRSRRERWGRSGSWLRTVPRLHRSRT